jgi:prepilin-type N-terminal cleavage/methylation domain-containing protein
MKDRNGFSLVELLLVLAIIGIISAIAIPSFLGQRRRARVIGDAESNAKALAMMLESRKAESGIYGPVTSQVWTYTGTAPSASISLAPSFTPKGNSKMNYRVGVAGAGLSFAITVTDPFVGSAQVLTLDQTGAVTRNPTYNH